MSMLTLGQPVCLAAGEPSDVGRVKWPEPMRGWRGATEVGEEPMASLKAC